MRIGSKSHDLSAPFAEIGVELPDNLWLLGDPKTAQVAIWVEEGAHGLAVFSQKNFAVAFRAGHPQFRDCKPGKASPPEAFQLASIKRLGFVHLMDDFLVPLTFKV